MQKTSLLFGALLLLAILLSPAVAVANSYGGGSYGIGNYGLGEQASPPGQTTSLQTQAEDAQENPTEPDASETPGENSNAQEQSNNTPESEDTSQDDSDNEDSVGAEDTPTNGTNNDEDGSQQPSTSPTSVLQEKIQRSPFAAKVLVAVAAILLIGVLGALLRPRPSRLR